MMHKYVIAYAAWFIGILVMAGIALAWYRHVEEIGLRELAARFRVTDDTEDPDNG